MGGEKAADRIEVRRALSLLFGPSEWHELRALPSARGQVVTIDDLDAACKAVDEVSDQQVYWNLNPIQPGSERASKGTVLSRRWFPVDIDTVRPKDVSATEAEKVACAVVAGSILDYLLGLGWPAPLMVDSGNGWHLLYRIDLPADKLTHQIIKGATYALAEKFDCGAAIVDRSTHDAARIFKLPGTMARKGPNTPERPHRLCRIAYEPDRLDLVDVRLLQELGGQPAGQPVNGTAEGHLNGTVWKTPVTSDRKNLDLYVRRAIEGECGKLAIAPSDRNVALNKAAFALGQFAAWPEMTEATARDCLYRTACQVGLDRDSNCGEQGILATIESGWQAGANEPRQRPADPSIANHAPIPNGKRIIWASSVTPRKVEWLWPNRIPLGKMTTFAGQTGVGKTFTVCDLAARITTGGEIPFGKGECFKRGKVLIISAEDDADDTIVPRFIEMKGDLSRLALLSPESEEKFSLSALELLNGCIDDMGPDVRMVAIDPPTSYLGRTDDHKNAELRGLLAPLRRWCMVRKVAMVFVTHINKSSAQNVDAMARVMGSVAWVTAVRAAHMFCQDPKSPGQSLFLPLKINNASKPKGLAYQISSSGDAAALKWLEEVDTSADEAMGQSNKKTRGESAIEWLEQRFRERREWPSDELRTMAGEYGLSKNALWEPAVQALPIKKRQRCTMDGKRFWAWIAEEGWPKTNGNLGNMGMSDRKSNQDIENHTFPESGVSGNLDNPKEPDGQIPRFPDSQIPKRGDGGNLGGEPEFPKPEGYPDDWEFFDGKGKHKP